MATTLRLVFGCADGSDRSISMSNPREDLDETAVRAAMESVVANGDVFDNALTGASSAELIDRTVTALFG